MKEQRTDNPLFDCEITVRFSGPANTPVVYPDTDASIDWHDRGFRLLATVAYNWVKPNLKMLIYVPEIGVVFVDPREWVVDDRALLDLPDDGGAL